jgi:hypothetical protein
VAGDREFFVAAAAGAVGPAPVVPLPVAIPDLPHPLALLSDDRPTALDRALVRRSTHVLCALGVLVSGAFLGVPVDLSCMLGFGVGYTGFLWGLLLPRRYVARGLYRRTMFFAEQLERRAWLPGGAFNWRMLRAACHMLLGELERARELMESVDPSRLSASARAGLHVNLAILHCQAVRPDRALEALSRVEPSRFSRPVRSCYHLVRASVLALTEDFAGARGELGHVEALGPPPLLFASCLSLRAYLAIEDERDGASALALSQHAIASAGRWYPGRTGMLLNHARIVLDATGNVQECLDLLGRIVGHEAELGLAGQAELHYLLGRCFLAAGMETDALAHAEQAARLRCTPRLRRRIEVLIEQVGIVQGPAAPGGGLLEARPPV